MSVRGPNPPTNSVALTVACIERPKSCGVTSIETDTSLAFDALTPARALVEARRAHRSLGQFPGPLPPDMAAAYRVQDATLQLWPEPVVGWKSGRIPEEL